MKAGDIVIWTPIPGKSGKEWRIVDVLSTQEPKQLLLTDVEGDGSKCNPALTCDCALVREGEPPKRVKEKAAVVDIWGVPDNCVVGVDR
jgi:hypothetical protein